MRELMREDEPEGGCPDADEGCRGAVELRMALSGKAFPRCDRHWEERVKTQEQINERYPAQAPADFDPLFAGERWEEE
jgi:hypothetical protein